MGGPAIRRWSDHSGNHGELILRRAQDDNRFLGEGRSRTLLVRGRGVGGVVVEIEMDGRRNVAAFPGLEVGADGKAGEVGDEVGGETLDGDVVGLGGLVEVIAGGGDAVLGAFKLGLEVEEALVGLEVGVPFRDDEEAREGVAEGALGLFEFLELGGIGGGLVGVDLDLADAGAGLGDFGEGRFLEVGGTGDGLDEIGDEIGATLVLIFHFGPTGIDAGLAADELVVAVGPEGADDDRENDDTEDGNAETAEDVFSHRGRWLGRW